jgi:hypothetical protein
MMSVTMKKVHEFAEFLDKKFTAYDFKPNGIVRVNHGDGTRYEFHCAFAKLVTCNEQEWLMVFSEHNGFHVFSVGDLNEDNGFGQFEIKPVEIISVGEIAPP